MHNANTPELDMLAYCYLQSPATFKDFATSLTLSSVNVLYWHYVVHYQFLLQFKHFTVTRRPTTTEYIKLTIGNMCISPIHIL